MPTELPPNLGIRWMHMRLHGGLQADGFNDLFGPALEVQPSVEGELREKWARAQAVHEARGTARIGAYGVSELA